MMWSIMLVVFSAGSFGGFVNALISGEIHLPNLDRETEVYRPGWLGNVAVGGVAALVFWGLYGPLASSDLIGASSTPEARLRVAEFFGAVLTGLGGGRVLTNEVDKTLLRHERDLLEDTKDSLAGTIMKLVERAR